MKPENVIVGACSMIVIIVAAWCYSMVPSEEEIAIDAGEVILETIQETTEPGTPEHEIAEDATSLLGTLEAAVALSVVYALFTSLSVAITKMFQ